MQNKQDNQLMILQIAFFSNSINHFMNTRTVMLIEMGAKKLETVHN